jgi:hypothetical protein
MRALLIATVSALVIAAGCVQQPHRAPIAAPASEPLPAATQPAPAATAASPGAANSGQPPTAAASAPRESEVPPAAAARPARAAPAARPVAPAPGGAPTAAVPAPPRQSAPAAPPGPPPSAPRSPANATPPSPAASTPAQPPVAAATPAPAAPPAEPTLDLAGLEQRLRETDAIGVLTKLSIKNQVDDLLEEFRGFYKGQVKVPLAELRQRYELLLLKVVSLLQDADRQLASAINSSREAIWGILADPQKFSQI